MNGLRDEYGGWVDVYFYDTENPANYGVVSQYGVRGLPTTIILDSNGNIGGRLSGFASADQLRAAINRVVYQ